MSAAARASSRPALRRVSLEAVFFDLRVEQTAVNTQHFRGFRAISGGVAEGLHDEVLLELGDGFLEEGLLDGDLVTAFFFMLAGLVIAERQLTARDDLPARKHDRALDDVLELTHVARPVVFHEALERFLADRGRLRGRAVTVLREEVLDERGYVLFAIAKRRHVDVDDVEPVKQVIAELLLLDLPLQVFVGRADDADVDLDRERRADALALALLEHAEVLRLHRWASLAGPVAQDLDLARQVAVLDDPLHGMADLVELERLGDVVEGAELHSADGVIGRAERGHDEDARLG